MHCRFKSLLVVLHWFRPIAWELSWHYVESSANRISIHSRASCLSLFSPTRICLVYALTSDSGREVIRAPPTLRVYLLRVYIKRDLYSKHDPTVRYASTTSGSKRRRSKRKEGLRSSIRGPISLLYGRFFTAYSKKTNSDFSM